MNAATDRELEQAGTGATLGQKIKALRTSNNLNLEEMGVILGCSKSTVMQWEHDRFKPKPGSIQKMSTHFNVPLEYFDFHEAALVRNHLQSIEGKKTSIPKVVLLQDVITGQQLQFKSEFFATASISEANACFLKVNDFENAPQINAGDLMLCEKRTAEQPLTNGLFVLRRDDFYLVRYVMRTARGKILLTTLAKGESFSEAEEFEPEEFKEFELLAQIQNLKLNDFIVR